MQVLTNTTQTSHKHIISGPPADDIFTGVSTAGRDETATVSTAGRDETVYLAPQNIVHGGESDREMKFIEGDGRNRNDRVCELMERLSMQVDQLGDRLDRMDLRLGVIEDSCGNMDNHIDVISDTYGTMRAPLDYVCDRIGRMRGTSVPSLPLP